SRCSSRAPAGVRSMSISAAVRAADVGGSAGSAAASGSTFAFCASAGGATVWLQPSNRVRRSIPKHEIRRAEKVGRFSRMLDAGMRNLTVRLLVGFRVTLLGRLFADSFKQTLEQKAWRGAGVPLSDDAEPADYQPAMSLRIACLHPRPATRRNNLPL